MVLQVISSGLVKVCRYLGVLISSFLYFAFLLEEPMVFSVTQDANEMDMSKSSLFYISEAQIAEWISSSQALI